jgi:hypothetical protein
MGGAEEASTDHVSKGVVFLVEGEDGSGWHACISNVSRMSQRYMAMYRRVLTSINLDVYLILAGGEEDCLVPGIQSQCLDKCRR